MKTATINMTRTFDVNTHIILGKVMNKPRVFLRIAAILSRMNFSVLQYKLIPTQDPRVHDLTLVIEGSALNLTAALKQIERLVDVLEVGKGFGHG